jgi:hypothetical protein
MYVLCNSTLDLVLYILCNNILDFIIHHLNYKISDYGCNIPFSDTMHTAYVYRGLPGDG